jgi:hypothetical protein
MNNNKKKKVITGFDIRESKVHHEYMSTIHLWIHFIGHGLDNTTGNAQQ